MMDAIVTAGGNPRPGEPLYEYTHGMSKALLDVAGRPMVQWVLDALDGSEQVERIVVVGLEEKNLMEAGIRSKKLVGALPTHGDLIENVRAGIMRVMEVNSQAHHVLYVSADIPTITSPMVDWLVTTTSQTEHDVYYNVITRQVMEARFPKSRRSYIHLRGMEVCGGDMNVLRARTVTGNEILWQRLVDSRKNALKQAALVGYDTLFLLLLRLLSLQEAEKTAAKRLGVRARVLVCPYAEIGMDVDKPHQLELVRNDLLRTHQPAQ